MKTLTIGSIAFTIITVSLIPNTRSRAAIATDDREAIRTFTVPTVPQAALEDLRRRIAATRWLLTGASKANDLFRYFSTCHFPGGIPEP